MHSAIVAYSRLFAIMSHTPQDLLLRPRQTARVLPSGRTCTHVGAPQGSGSPHGDPRPCAPSFPAALARKLTAAVTGAQAKLPPIAAPGVGHAACGTAAQREHWVAQCWMRPTRYLTQKQYELRDSWASHLEAAQQLKGWATRESVLVAGHDEDSTAWLQVHSSFVTLVP